MSQYDGEVTMFIRLNSNSGRFGLIFAVMLLALSLGYMGCNQTSSTVPDGDIDTADGDTDTDGDIIDIPGDADPDPDKTEPDPDEDLSDDADPDDAVTDGDEDDVPADQADQEGTEEAPVQCEVHCLCPDPTSLDFGAVQVGVPKTKTVQISSCGLDAVTIFEVRLSSDTSTEFSIVDNPVLGTMVLAPRQILIIDIEYLPADPDPDEGRLVISSSDDTRGNIFIPLTSGFKGTASLGVAPESIDFGDIQAADLPKRETFVLSCLPDMPDDNRPLTISQIQLSDDSSETLKLVESQNCTPPIQLFPNESVSCQVEFDSDIPETYTGTIQIDATDGIKEAQHADVPVSVKLTRASLAIDPSRIDFGYVITNTHHQQDVQLTNTGDATLQLTAVALALEGSPLTFELPADFLDEPLAPGVENSKTFTIKYDPTVNDSYDLNTIYIFSATAPRFEVMVSGLSFDPCPQGFESDYEAGICIPHCTPGDKFCSGNGFRICLDDGESLSEIIPCDDGTYCSDGTCISQICEPGVQQCNEAKDRVLRCNQLGSEWVELLICQTNLMCRSSECVQLTQTSATCEEILEDGTACDDSDYCTVNDTCSEGLCMGEDRECPDDNTCTRDICDSDLQMCTHPPETTGTLCDDGNPCTTNDRCSDTGRCSGNGVKSCDDNNICTDDSCDPSTAEGCVNAVVENRACSDGNACTENDYCTAEGVCVGGTAPDCDDDDVCTHDFCGQYGCQHTGLSGMACDDDNPCTTNDNCQSGTCVGGGTLACNDNNTCTFDHCVKAEGGCVYDPVIGASCNDGNQCTTSDSCVDDGQGGAVCQGGATKDCNDNKECTGDTCDPVLGCVYSNLDGNTCDDGNPCTEGDTCFGGSCRPGTGPDCNDDNQCTRDTCEPGTGDCINEPLPANTECDDGNACTQNDYCNGNGVCIPGSSPDCNDNKPCTDDICDPVEGCRNIPNNANTCDDGDPCTTHDYCYSGVCRGDTIDTCDDSNDCTTDQCISGSGCTHAPRSGGCDDGNACTYNDRCVPAAGTANCIGTTQTCNDNKTCTDDSCDPATGCVYTAVVGRNCSDNNQCTVGDACDADGVCQPGSETLTCTDNNECTLDQCNPLYGCQFPSVQNGAQCSDNNECTLGDYCTNGVCQPGAGTLSCFDGRECTDDSCNPATGCVFIDDDTNDCSDSDPCTQGDYCDAGVCIAGATPRNCSDGNPCTDNWCDASDYRADLNGCVTEGKANGSECDVDNSLCTIDQCWNLNCIFNSNLNCDDGNECSQNLCNPASGCYNPPVNDGIACTDDTNDCTWDQCQSGTCTHPNKSVSESCDDGAFCSVNDHCDGGGDCVSGGSRDCTGQCTTGACLEGSDVCQPVADYTPCNDGNSNTIEDACINGECLGTTNWLTEGECPGYPEMVKVPGTRYCIDKYEASLMDDPYCEGTQYGVATDNYPGGFPNDVSSSNETTPLYACSLPGRRPSQYATYFQARRSCQNIGKNLCSPTVWKNTCEHNQGWDYPYGNSYQGQTCHAGDHDPNDATVNTGSMTGCVNSFGAYDLSGNVEEWVEESCTMDGRRTYGGDYQDGQNNVTCGSSTCRSKEAERPYAGVRCCIGF